MGEKLGRLALRREDAKLLHDSAIKKGVAIARGYRSISNGASGEEALIEAGFNRYTVNRRPGLLIPLLNASGRVWGYQYRPDNPRHEPGRAGSSGRRLRKYETPPGQNNNLDWAPGTASLLRERKNPLIVTEGSRKADAAVSVGVAAISLQGVQSWRTEEWNHAKLRERPVYLCFDSDAADNADVNRSLRKLAIFLKKAHGAHVKLCRLSSRVVDHVKLKVGLDDYLAASGDIDELLLKAEDVEELPIVVKGKDGRPPLDMSNPAEAAKRIMEDISRDGGPLAGIFQRGVDLVEIPHINSNGYSLRNASANSPVMDILNTDKMVGAISAHYTCYRTATVNGVPAPVSTLPKPEAARTVMAEASKRAPNLRTITTVTATPSIKRNGRLMLRPGYDEDGGLLYIPDSTLNVRVPKRPTARDVAKARELIKYVIGDFPFVTESDRVNYVGLMFTPLLRMFLTEGKPLGIINAHMQRTGKTYLARILYIIHGGLMSPAFPDDEAEMEKTITTFLQQSTGPVIVFDNVRKRVRSTSLESLLTMPTWTRRMLGSNTQVTLPNDKLWIATGNNVTISNDMANRCLWTTIDADTPRPWERRGKEADILAYVSRMRGEILSAMLTLYRAWRDDGRPMVKQDRFDPFGKYKQLMVSLLQWAEFDGQFWSDETKVMDESEDDAEWGQFMEAMWSLYGGDVIPVARVWDDALDKLQDSIPWQLSNKVNDQVSFRLAAGRFFKSKDGQWANNYKLEYLGRVSDKGKAACFRLHNLSKNRTNR